MRPPREENVNARREILTAAGKCFGEKGYAGTSIQDIISETRFSKPVIYYYFGNKEGLFLALLEEAYDESHAVMEECAASSGTVRDRLIRVTHGLFAFHQTRRSMTRLAFSAAFASSRELPSSEKFQDLRERNMDLVRGLVKEGLDTGEISADAFDLETLTYGIYGAICFYLMSDLTLRDVRLDEEMAGRIVDLYLQGAMPRTQFREPTTTNPLTA